MAEMKDLKSFLLDTSNLKKLLMNGDLQKALSDVAKSSLTFWGFSYIPVKLIWNDGKEVAYINDSECVINLNSALDQDKSFTERKKLAIGKLAHEVFGHGLFTNFALRNHIAEELENENFVLDEYFQKADNFDAETFNKIKSFYQSNKFSFMKVFFNIENIIEDPTVEYFGVQKYKGFKVYLTVLLDELKNTFKPDTDNPLNALLMQARGVEYPKVLSTFPFLEDTRKIFENIPNMTIYEDRIIAACSACMYMWDSLVSDKNEEQNANDSNSTNGSGESSEITDDFDDDTVTTSSNDNRSQNGEGNQENQKTANSKKNNDGKGKENETSEQKSSTSDTTDETEKDIDKKDGSNTADNNSENSSSSSENDSHQDSFEHSDNETGVTDITEMKINSMVDNLANETISEYVDRLLAKTSDKTELERQCERKEVNDIVCDTNYHKDYPFEIHHGRVGTMEEYNYLCTNELKSIAHNLANQVVKKIRMLQKTSIMYEQEEGTMLDLNAYCNKSDKFFMTINQPNKKNVMAATVLVDQSGSMAGERNESAVLATMVIERFCRELNIPINIIGHNDSGGVHLYNYIEHYDPPTQQRGRNIVKMGTGGCNRDGFAIRYALNKLLKRKEPVRLMFVISDGAPNSVAYGTEQAIKDIADIKRMCKKKHVTLIALAIADDIPQLQKIYGSSLVDARNLKEFPKTLTSMLLRELKKTLL